MPAPGRNRTLHEADAGNALARLRLRAGVMRSARLVQLTVLHPLRLRSEIFRPGSAAFLRRVLVSVFVSVRLVLVRLLVVRLGAVLTRLGAVRGMPVLAMCFLAMPVGTMPVLTVSVPTMSVLT